MRLSERQLHDLFVLYNLHADYQPLGLDRTVAMLGMMACCAAKWGKLRDMPQAWGWPRAVSEVVPGTPRAQN